MTNPCDDVESNECQEALLRIYEFLDGQMTVEKRTVIATHIELCGHCNDTYSFEMHVRKVVSTRCSDAVPDALKAKIIEAIQQAQRNA